IVVVAVPSPFTVPNRIAVAVRVARRVLTALALFDASVDRAGVVVRASDRLAFATAEPELAHFHTVAVDVVGAAGVVGGEAAATEQLIAAIGRTVDPVVALLVVEARSPE